MTPAGSIASFEATSEARLRPPLLLPPSRPDLLFALLRGPGQASLAAVLVSVRFGDWVLTLSVPGAITTAGRVVWVSRERVRKATLMCSWELSLPQLPNAVLRWRGVCLVCWLCKSDVHFGRHSSACDMSFACPYASPLYCYVIYFVLVEGQLSFESVMHSLQCPPSGYCYPWTWCSSVHCTPCRASTVKWSTCLPHAFVMKAICL